MGPNKDIWPELRVELGLPPTASVATVFRAALKQAQAAIAEKRFMLTWGIVVNRFPARLPAFNNDN